MKKFLSFLILSVSVFTGFAQWRNSNIQFPNGNNGIINNYQSSSLIVNTYTNNSFTVMVDNRYQYQSNGQFNKSVNVGSLNAGSHTITIYQWRTNFWGKQKQEIVYNATLYFKPNVETTLNVNNFGQVNINERQIYQNGVFNNGINNGRYRTSRNDHKDDRDNCRKNDDYDRNIRIENDHDIRNSNQRNNNTNW